jgi:phenylalanyl-tRNA synthetase alpha chain
MPADLLAELDLAAARAEIAAARSLDDLEEARRQLTGKGSAAARVKQAIKDLPGDEKPVVGRAVSEYTAAVTEAIDARRDALTPTGGGEPPLDLTLGRHARRRGHLHLVTQCRRELEDVFVGLGYQVAGVPRSRTTGTTSRRSTSHRATRRGPCRTRCTSTSASPNKCCCGRTPRRSRSG